MPVLGVPFDPVTTAEAINFMERMIASRKPHYVVTANIDFVVQAQSDVELRRILFDADLVLCDGTPLVWVSRLFGRALPERVAGADIVPQLIRIAALKRHRIFLLGASPESATRAVENLRRQYPQLPVIGHYSPPFRHLLEMDHAEAVARIRAAKPDLLLVSFGCPKQEKWLAMHYRSLGVPVSIGVGATIDFLAGHMKRAPVWMQRSGTEWIFRLLQEPRRLFKRYIKDLCVFGWRILGQCRQLQLRGSARAPTVDIEETNDDFHRILLPPNLDRHALARAGRVIDQVAAGALDCLVDGRNVRRVDATGVGLLIRLQKTLQCSGRRLVLLRPAARLQRVLEFMRLDNFFLTANNATAAKQLVACCVEEQQAPVGTGATPLTERLLWRGEITAANAARVWSDTHAQLNPRAQPEIVIDLSRVRFVDSSGVDVMRRIKQHAGRADLSLCFANPQPAVHNVLRCARLDRLVLGRDRQTGSGRIGSGGLIATWQE